MKTITSSALGVLLILGLGATASFASSEDPVPSCGKGMNEDRMPMMRPLVRPGDEIPMDRPGPLPLRRHLAELGLDEKQLAIISVIEIKSLKEGIRKRAEIELTGLDLRETLEKDAVDMGLVEGKLKKLEALKTDMEMLHIKTMEEVKSVLTPEQKKKLKEMFAKGPHREKHMARAIEKNSEQREP